MVRPKNQRIWKHFTDPGDKSATCKFCKHKYKLAHVAKMTNHLLKCKSCPDRVKEDLKSNDQQAASNYAHEKTEQNVLPTLNTVSADELTDPITLPDQQEQEIHTLLAKAIYVTGTPLSIVEHPLWQQLFFKLQPSYKLPSRKAISTTYLENTFNNMGSEIRSLNYLHLQLDGWTDENNAGIINFIISKPEPVFVQIVDIGENQHAVEYLKEEILKVMSEYDEQKFVVLIGDNARNVQRAFQLVKQTHPHVSPLNCAAHTLNLLCQDIMQPKLLKLLLDRATDVVKTFKQSQLLTAFLKGMVTERNTGEILQLPLKTQWSSYCACLKSLENTKTTLRSLAMNQSVTNFLPQETRAALLDDSFWEMTKQSIKIMEPISDVITRLQSNTCNMVNFFITIKDMRSKLDLILPEINILSTEDRRAIITAVDHRISMCLKPIHLAAHLLDPRSLGSELNESEEMATLEYINDMAEQLGTNVMSDLANYKSKEGNIWGKSFVWSNTSTISPIAWWKGICSSSSLSEIACRILSAPCSSSAVERSFSTYRKTDTKKRNEIISERASKMAIISYNWIMENAKHNENNDVDGCFELEESEPSTSSRNVSNIMSKTGQKFEFMECGEQNTSDSDSD